MKQLQFQTKYGEMTYYQLGEGKKALVFLHGFLGMPLFLDELHERFRPKGYFVAAPVLPGHGKSFPLPKGFLFDDLYACVENFLNSLGVKEINLVGHSMGGGLSWQLGQGSNLPIKKIIMLSPGLGHFRPRNFDYVLKFAKDLKFDYPHEWFVTYFLKAIKKEGQWQQIVFPQRMVQMVKSVEVRFRDFPRGIKAVALWGKDDLITPFEDYQEKLAQVRNLQVKFFPGGHHWFIVHKEEFLRELESLL